MWGKILQDGDVLLTLGAGDIGSAAARLAGDLTGNQADVVVKQE